MLVGWIVSPVESSTADTAVELSCRHGYRAKAKDQVEPNAQFINLSLLSGATPEVVSLHTRTVSQHSKWSQKLRRWSRPSQGTV